MFNSFVFGKVRRIIHVSIYLAEWIVFLAQSDWFLYLKISCTIHIRAKQDGVRLCLRYGRTFFNKRSRHARQHQKSIEIWQLSIQRYAFLLFLAINTLRMLCLQMMSG